MPDQYQDTFDWEVVRPDSGADTLKAIQAVIEDVGAPQELHVQTLMHTSNFRGEKAKQAEALEAERVRLKAEPFDTLRVVNLRYDAKQNQHLTLRYDVNTGSLHAKFSVNGAQKNPGVAEKLVAACAKHFRWATWEESRFVGMPAAYQEHVRAVEETFSKREERMNAAFERLVQQQERAGSKLAKDREAFEGEKQKERDALQVERETQEKELRAEREALEDRERQFEMRDSEIVRRDIQKQTNELLERYEDFEVSKPTIRKRWPVHGAAVAGILLAIGLYVWVAHRILERDQIDALRVSMLATATILLATVFGFYLRFMTGWFNLRARAEADIRTFRVDWLRASWLVELLFQWRKPTDGGAAPKDMPPEVLHALSRGLFSESQEEEADAMKRLLGALPKVKRVDFGKIAGVEVERVVEKSDD